MVNENQKEKKVDLPYLFIVILVLFTLSLGLIITSFIKGNKVFIGGPEKSEKIEEKDQKDSSLYDYFDEKFSEKNEVDPSDYYENDPFKEVCGQGRDDQPSINSNTVCLY